MTNWCFCTLELKGKRKILESIKKQVKSSRSEFDFDMIVQTPEELLKQKNIDTSYRNMLYYLLFHKNKEMHRYILGLIERRHIISLIKEDVDSTYYGTKENIEISNEGLRLFSLVQKYGASNWYDWRRLYWGTIWTTECREDCVAYITKNSLRYQFDTAWEAPVTAILNLSCQYPSIKMKLEVSYEEDGGETLHLFEYYNGKLVKLKSAERKYFIDSNGNKYKDLDDVPDGTEATPVYKPYHVVGVNTSNVNDFIINTTDDRNKTRPYFI